jgi:hypothetical protein
VRLPSFVVSTEVVSGLPDERLTIRHDAGGTPEPSVAGTLIAVRRVPALVGSARARSQSSAPLSSRWLTSLSPATKGCDRPPNGS